MSSHLKVKLAAGDGKTLKEAVVRIDGGKEVSTQQGIADCGAVAAGKHTLKIVLSVDDARDYATTLSSLEDELTIELKPDEDKTETVMVEPKFKTIRFVAYCLATVAKQVWQGDSALVDEFNSDQSQHGPLDPVEWWGAKAGKQTQWKVQYNGTKTDRDDIDARVELLKYALANAAIHTSSKASELKVFIVPECFFLGRYGAYGLETFETLIKKLQQLVRDPQWKSWIFAFGTVNGFYETESAGVMEMFNTAPVIKGGFGSDNPAKYTRLIRKWRFSQELPADADLIHQVEEERPPLTEDVVQRNFGPTENETKLGNKVQELLTDILNDRAESVTGITAWTTQRWADLQSGAAADVRARGLTQLVRDLRAKSFGAKPWLADLRAALESYLAAGPEKDRLLSPPRGANFSYDDSCISSKRVPGPWLERVVLSSEPAALAAKLTFGVEICADHINQRLKQALSGAAVKPVIDVQLVPSAGAQITKGSVAVAKGGYVINCDGWNAPGFCGGPKQRNAKYVELLNEKLPRKSGNNPLYPHSELWKVDKAGVSETYINQAKDIKVIGLERDISDIFSYPSQAEAKLKAGTVSAGELHIYPAQDLPTNYTA